jgi:hypothetical protein
MPSVRLSGREFADLLRVDEAHERLVDTGASALVVEGDDVGALDRRSLDRLQTLAAVVVGVVADPEGTRPEWADLVVAPHSPELLAALAAVDANPQASTTLALLLRGGAHRTVGQGLVAESMAYGLLQHGPEFARWRHRHPVPARAEPPGPAVLVTRRDHELSVTLHRPHVLNAFNTAMRDELLAALQVAVVDPSVRSVILRGAGDSFSSGGDLDEFGSRPDAVSAHLVRMQRNAGRTLARLAGITTVHIHGSTIGSGIELAAFARRVVADRSTRISLPEVHLGLIPGAGGTVSLPRRIGRHATLLLALAMPSIDAHTARAWHLVDALES